MFCPLIFKYHPEIKHRNKVFNGSIKFEVTKSRKSNSVLPNILKPPQHPNDKDAGIAISEMIQNSMVQAFLREIPNRSIIVAQGPSTMLIPEVNAAQKSNTKNADDIIPPKGICENILGRVTNTNPAPEFGSIPKENTAGNIIIPARTAKVVSDKIIV